MGRSPCALRRLRQKEDDMRALRIAATGMEAQQMRVEVISNNLANMSTTAYNARRAEFADLHYQQAARPGTVNAADGSVLPTGVQLGLGVRAAAVSMDVSQGALEATGNELDVAIEGAGYLEVVLPSGQTGYTRDGALKRTGDGVLVNSDGYEIQPQIVIPDDARSVSVNANGEVFAYFLDQVAGQQLGQLTLSTFSNQKGLEAIGGNLYLETAASGAPSAGDPGADGRGTFRQGFLEESSVDPVRQITDLIEAQRGYELNAKVITAADQMLGATTQIR
jgi:flagellar basal-body rod protein FlgG